MSCVPRIASELGNFYLRIPSHDIKSVSDHKECSPAVAALYVAATVHVIYALVNTVLRFLEAQYIKEKAFNVMMTFILLIFIAVSTHYKTSNHLKSMGCTGIASLATSTVYASKCWSVGNYYDAGVMAVGYIFVIITTGLALSTPVNS